MLAGLAPLVGAYARAARRLRARGVRVPAAQRAAWYTGVALRAVALISPLDTAADDLLSLHMVQHVLIAELVPPLLVAGLRWPVHLFVAPRPLVVAGGRDGGRR